MMKRDIDGILLLDKPKGITSNEALQTVKRFYGARKAGHAGSLDPIATGMLPILFGEGTKFSHFLLEADKKYDVTAKLGVTTDSGDAEGKIIERGDWTNVTSAKLEKILPKFRGKISQIPSMYSALKYKGEPLYKLARQGIEVERAPREINIYKLELISIKEDALHLMVHCSKGTYVRTLVSDIGREMGCGAYVSELRRLSVGPFLESQMVSMDKIKDLSFQNHQNELDSLLLSIDSCFPSWKEIILSDEMVYYIIHGNPLFIPNAPTSGWVRLKDKSGKFLGVGEVLPDGKIAPRRLVKTI